jgi:hypothetical protein
MTSDNDNEFGDFENDFKNAEKAAPGGATGLVPDGPYKVACTAVDVEGNGQAVDHHVFKAKTGTKGFKLFLEILEPAEVQDPVTQKLVKTKGEIVEHVLWITQANMKLIKRDAATILGRELTSLAELKQIVWLGKTCEVGLRAEIYQGFKSSKVNYFNPWVPERSKSAAAPAAPPKKAPAGAVKAATAAASAPAKAPGAEEESPDF